MIKGENYLKKLIGFKDKKLIKIITRIPRSAKSTLFQIFKDYLFENGIEKDQIITVNFEDADFANILYLTRVSDNEICGMWICSLKTRTTRGVRGG